MSTPVCLISGKPLTPIMSFGQMPIANGFLSEREFEREVFFQMDVGFCSESCMFQLLDQPSPEEMFNENYAFFSGTSSAMATHFECMASSIINEFLYKAHDPFVLEIGCNDGILIKHFASKGFRHLGVEPSLNVANVARDQGINVISEFFNAETAAQILKTNGKASLFTAANVMCHIPSIQSVVEGIKVILADEGVVVFEDPYLGDVIEKTTYDQIYDEHTFLFSVHSIQYLFKKFGLELFHVEPQVTHGGSMRYFLGHSGAHDIRPSVSQHMAKEKKLGLTEVETFNRFKTNCEVQRDKLVDLLRSLRASGKRISGYAATSKSTTILNYCGISTDLIDCIYDTTPIKQGKYSPGAHIPIVDHANFSSNYPDYALLFGYNHEKEIMAKESEFMAQGGKWISYVPEVKILT